MVSVSLRIIGHATALNLRDIHTGWLMHLVMLMIARILLFGHHPKALVFVTGGDLSVMLLLWEAMMRVSGSRTVWIQVAEDWNTT